VLNAKVNGARLMFTVRQPRQPRRTRTDQLLATENQILDYLCQDVEEGRKTGERYDRQQQPHTWG